MYVICHIQVHLTYWSSTSVLVSWATCDAQVTDSAPPPPPVNQHAVVIYGPAPGRYTQAAVGVATSYVYDYGKLKQASYVSPLLHHVLLSGLTPGATYHYTLGVPVSLAAGSAVGPGPKEYNFTVGDIARSAACGCRGIIMLRCCCDCEAGCAQANTAGSARRQV
jgi:hypothetical protein